LQKLSLPALRVVFPPGEVDRESLAKYMARNMTNEIKENRVQHLKATLADGQIIGLARTINHLDPEAPIGSFDSTLYPPGTNISALKQYLGDMDECCRKHLKGRKHVGEALEL
jgi:hypothetical protein